MNDNEQRDELARDIHKALGDVTGIYDTSETEDQELAAAILAAGYSKPRTITTVKELNALPAFSVIRIQQDKTLERLSDGWYMAALEETFIAFPIWLPATVIHEPATEATK